MQSDANIMPPLVRIKHWPARPERARFVAVYRQGGKRQVRYFKAEKLAKTFAMQKEVELLNEGRRHGPITERERRALYIAREAGVDVAEAIDSFIAQHAARERCASVELAAEELLERRESEGKSRGHVKDLRGRFRAFCAAHEGKTAAEITTRDVDAWLASLSVAAQTRLNCRRVIHNLFAFCVSRGYATSNPVTASARPKVPPKAPGILTIEQARALLEACPREIVAPVAIGAFAGLRHSEIERLDWRDVDLERGFIHVSAAKSKTAQRRLVTISQNLRSWLERANVSAILKKGGEPGSLPFSTPVCPSNYRALFRKAHRAAGIAVWPKNALRHSFASYHLALHQDAAKTALLLGHMESRTLFAHYRELVTRENAKSYWKIFPLNCI
jgi:integrase